MAHYDQMMNYSETIIPEISLIAFFFSFCDLGWPSCACYRERPNRA